MKATAWNTGRVFGFVLGALILAGSATASTSDDGQDGGPEAKRSRSFALDNDALVNGSRDKDYSFGLNMTYRGQGVTDHFLSMHTPLGWLDNLIGLESTPLRDNSAQIEYGFYAFTPDEISESKPIDDDRPYASLTFISNSHERYQAGDEVAWHSTLTVGILGLDFAGDIQDGIHTLTDSEDTEGWDNQISDGGEPTARYALARSNLLYKNSTSFEIKSTVQGSVGYLTEASWGLGLRAGNIHTPWSSFTPELTTYGERPNPSDLAKVSEHYLWTGFSLTARAYSAFLQGQFRDSEVTYDSGDLNIGMASAWLGYTHVFENGYSLSYSMRGQTSEFDDDDSDEIIYWGTLSLSKYFF